MIVGAYEHPDRIIKDRSVATVHAEVARGALADAGLTMDDVDGLFAVGGDITLPGLALADYLGLTGLRYVDTSMTGGSSPVCMIGHAAAAIADGRCRVALITLAARARSSRPAPIGRETPDVPFEQVYGSSTLGMYALAAMRHMHEFGTTSEQLAEIKVAASLHAQHNPRALLRTPVTVEEVLASPLVSDPLRRMDCCVVSDGGGAVVMVAADVARDLERRGVRLLGQSETVGHTDNGTIGLTATAARWTAPRAFAEAGVGPDDIDYASIYDSFTITVLETLEDLGFCDKGKGGAFVADGALRAPFGRLPINTDGGGLCNNHPSMGGMSRLVEAVRQLRGEAAPEVQVADCGLALVHGSGGRIGSRHVAATAILAAEGA
ncbi:thiolase domain-containing protein [Aeromicrobium wangtongii]|uniref:thiolase domain-containing protein n=1 Tax=Aeromicrobium wangtongii TaxID=2969247 RepID=UPI002017C056|nr:thiolase domain-containing protein [Aeromicrobium wangtongii]MCL3819416.1 thiolase domain-containing protein [Aeromicrobium wangtongii]